MAFPDALKNVKKKGKKGKGKPDDKDMKSKSGKKC